MDRAEQAVFEKNGVVCLFIMLLSELWSLKFLK